MSDVTTTAEPGADVVKPTQTAPTQEMPVGQSPAVVEPRPSASKVRASSIMVTKNGISPNNAGEVMALANMMAQSVSAIPPHLRGNPGDCLGIIDDALRFGMSPYALARKSYFVNNNLAYEAQAVSAMLMAGLPMKKRPAYKWEGEGVDMRCTVTIFPVDGDPVEHQSPKIKDITTKNSPLWKSDPPQQLGYYTVRACARLHFPDVLLGVYDREEMAEVMRDVTPTKPTIADRLPGAQDVSHLESDRLESEMKGTAAPVQAAEDAAAAVAVDPVAEFLKGVREDLASATSEAELVAIEESAVANMAATGADQTEAIAAAVAERRGELAKPKKNGKKGGSLL